MAKRGRPRLKSGDKKGAHVSVRLNAELLSQLEAAAAINDVSTSQEISSRLAMSFERPRARFDALGGEFTFNVFKLVAIALEQIRQQTGHTWHENAFSFRLAADAIEEIIACFRPTGPQDRYPKDGPQLAGVSGDKRILVRKRLESPVMGTAIGLSIVLAMSESGRQPGSALDRKLVEIKRSLRPKLIRTGGIRFALRNLKMAFKLMEER